ncbi:MAG: hypothetical protein O2820_19740 [Planctomycetota bacterium]|nr:hypothetical protein [Planctomycetota bacterium]MDA1251449.1 hypothetical protein [Planctomycetota bacterium]
MSEIKVWVVNRKSRKYLQLEANNAETGEKFSKSARTTKQKEEGSRKAGHSVAG